MLTTIKDAIKNLPSDGLVYLAKKLSKKAGFFVSSGHLLYIVRNCDHESAQSISTEYLRLNTNVEIKAFADGQQFETGKYNILEYIPTEEGYIDLHFDDLFTKKDEVYSGSEATIFHLSRLYALSKVLNHNYPIVVDSFRAEDLSTSKENIVLDLYKELSNQVIFTTTLKLEELGKYDTRTDIHHIDYKDHAPSKMLSEVYVNEFCELLSSLSINL